MNAFLFRLFAALEPLLPGLVLAGLFILVLIGLRIFLRGDRLNEKLRLPSTLVSLYFFTLILVVAAKLYWVRVAPVLEAAALFALALAIILAIAFGLFDLFLGRYREINIPRIFRDLIVAVIYIIAVFIILGHFGVDLTGVLTTSAVVTAVIGLALQDLLSSFISGLALQIEQPFAANDWIKFGDQEGKVLEINWRSTKIQTLHHDIVVVPNNVITKSSLINLSQPTPIHRRKLTLGLRYETPPNRAKEAILKAARGVEGVLATPEPFVLLTSYDDFSIAYRLHFFVDELHLKERIEDRVFTRLWYQLKRDGLSIPFPIRDINIHQPDPEKEEQAHQREIDRIASSIAKVHFLEPLKDREVNQLATSIRRISFGIGERIIRQGDEGDSFYIIKEGRVKIVHPNGRILAELNDGDYFGEMSLMTGEQRKATVIALTDVECYVVSKDSFERLIQDNEALITEVSKRLIERQASIDATQEEVKEEKKVIEQQEDKLVERIRRFFSIGK